MLRIVVRLLAFAALLAAMAAGTVDGARSIADGAVSVTSLGGAGEALLPRQAALLASAMDRALPAFLRDPVLGGLLALPAAPTLFAVGLGLLAAAQPSRRPIIAPERPFIRR